MRRLFVLLFIGALATGGLLLSPSSSSSATSKSPAKYSWTRLKRSPNGFIFHLLKKKLHYFPVEKIPTTPPTTNCICVPYYQCDANNTIISDGEGAIDPRFAIVTFRRCTGDLEVCCKPPPASMAPIVNPTPPPTTQPPTTQPPTTQPPTTQPPTTQPPTTQPPTTQPPTTQPPTTQPPTTQPPTTQPPTTQPPTTQPPTFPPLTCICVPAEQCDANGVIIVGGEGVINPRQTMNLCPIAGQVCCKPPGTSITFPTTAPVVTLPTLPSIPPVSQPVTCVCVLNFQCDNNGYIIISGTGNIDPRFPIGRQGQVAGTCVAATEICCKIVPIGQGTVIGYPIVNNNNAVGAIKNPGTPQACICVKSWQCAQGNVVYLDGLGIIDPRFSACPCADEVCCRLQGITRNLPSGSIIATGNTNVIISNPPNPPGTSAICGIRRTACTAADQTCATNPGEASFAEFPWMVALLIRKPDGTTLFKCGASMLNTRSVLTAAHCVMNRESGALIARFGEWNTANNNEPAPFQESVVQTVITHPQYYNGGLYNDVAVLILATPVTYAVNVMPICLPPQGTVFPAGQRCWATGWGRNAFEGQYQTIMRKVDLPIVDRASCETRLRSTRLGQYFQLHGSFICAGGEISKDTCRGDGGGPLVCPTATGQYVQAGIVAWGIGCGESNVPAVYASVSLFRLWIDQQLANYGVS